MRITDVRPVLLTHPYGTEPSGRRSACFVEVGTDTGITGVGETYAGVYVLEIAASIVERSQWRDEHHARPSRGSIRQWLRVLTLDDRGEGIGPLLNNPERLPCRVTHSASLTDGHGVRGTVPLQYTLPLVLSASTSV